MSIQPQSPGKRIPTVLMRGGTSRGPFILERDLPADPASRDRVLIEMMGSPDPLQVNGIGPGYFRTELTEKLVHDVDFTKWLVGRTPSRRWGDVEELAGAAVFLASDAASFVNGHVLYVDGGVTATL